MEQLIAGIIALVFLALMFGPAFLLAVALILDGLPDRRD